MDKIKKEEKLFKHFSNNASDELSCHPHLVLKEVIVIEHCIEAKARVSSVQEQIFRCSSLYGPVLKFRNIFNGKHVLLT